ncbi:MAG: hypothetical protein AAF633_15780, partial [Chloroflexota bacterium]
NWLESRRLFDHLTWRNFLPAFTLLAGVMLIQILTNAITLEPWPPGSAQLEIAIGDINPPNSLPIRSDAFDLIVEIDGTPTLLTTIPANRLGQSQKTAYFSELPLTPGPHTIHLYLRSESGRATLLRAWPIIEENEVYRLQIRRPIRHPADIKG